MVSAFDALEADFFGELAQDTHGLWEVFEFVRSRHPELSDQQVFEPWSRLHLTLDSVGLDLHQRRTILSVDRHELVRGHRLSAATRSSRYKVLGEFTID